MERRHRPVSPEGVTAVLAGPTGVGKTELALELAERLGVEILSADSRQAYRGLDIGTAKPTPDQLARVRHHWIDVLDVGQPTSAGLFARAFEQLAEVGPPPLVVGGSTLYIDAVVRGLADLPDVPPDTAAAAFAETATPEGRAALFAELAAADPVAAATLDPTKTQRLARLVGLLRATGRAPSEWWTQTRPPCPDVRLFVLTRPREDLYARIEARIDQMLDDGLVDENRRLLAAGVTPDASPLRTIGYQEPMAFLRGEISKSVMVHRLKQNTRRYAKRQLTWFRRYPDAVWIDASSLSFATRQIKEAIVMQ